VVAFDALLALLAFFPAVWIVAWLAGARGPDPVLSVICVVIIMLLGPAGSFFCYPVMAVAVLFAATSASAIIHSPRPRRGLGALVLALGLLLTLSYYASAFYAVRAGGYEAEADLHLQHLVEARGGRPSRTSHEEDVRAAFVVTSNTDPVRGFEVLAVPRWYTNRRFFYLWLFRCARELQLRWPAAERTFYVDESGVVRSADTGGVPPAFGPELRLWEAKRSY
jgi:hypothetical protein